MTISGRPAPNFGIYPSVVDQEMKCKKNYKYCSTLINSCLGLQIVVAAALTALGAANGSRGAVTVFGAINTVIAGFLTYLKGSGLPNRLKYFKHEWSKVREYIEQRERDLTCPGVHFDVHEQVDIIRNMYEEVKGDIEANSPDRFVAIGNLRPRSPPVNPAPALGLAELSGNKVSQNANGRLYRLATGLSDETHNIKGKASSLGKELGDVEEDIEGHGHVAASRVLSSRLEDLKSIVEEKLRDIRHLERQIGSHVRDGVDPTEQHAGQLEKGVESGTSRVVEGGERDLEAQSGHKIDSTNRTETEVARIGEEAIDSATKREKHVVEDSAGVSRTSVGLQGPVHEGRQWTSA